MLIYASIQDLYSGATGKVYETNAALLEDIKPALTWNGYYFDVVIRKEEDLPSLAQSTPPPGLTANDEEHNKLYFLNKIYDHHRELIPSGWSRIRWVVGLHRTHHVKTSYPAMSWYEVSWSVVGIVAIDWPGKEEEQAK